MNWAAYQQNSSDGYAWNQTDRYAFVPNPYLRSNIIQKYTYAGAAVKMKSIAKPSLLSGRLYWQYGASSPADLSSLGDELSWSSEAFENSGDSFSSYGQRLKETEQRMKNLSRHDTVESIAAAKAFGSLGNDISPHKAGIILPVYRDVRLIPAALVPDSQYTHYSQFYQFIIDYFAHPAYLYLYENDIYFE